MKKEEYQKVRRKTPETKSKRGEFLNWKLRKQINKKSKEIKWHQWKRELKPKDKIKWKQMSENIGENADQKKPHFQKDKKWKPVRWNRKTAELPGGWVGSRRHSSASQESIWKHFCRGTSRSISLLYFLIRYFNPQLGTGQVCFASPSKFTENLN